MKIDPQNTIRQQIRLPLVLLFLSLFINFAQAQDAILEWANSTGGNSDDECLAIATDNDGNVYSTGYFQESVDFDPGSGTYSLYSFGPGNRHVFIQKLDADGHLVWVRKFGSSVESKGLSIAVDFWGNIYVTGYYGGNMEFDPGSGNLFPATGSRDAFVVKYDSNGNFLWVVTTTNQFLRITEGRGIDTDSLGFVYITGVFAGTVDFDPGPGVANISSPSNGNDIFVQKLDTAGNFVWAKAMHGSNNHQYGNAITTDNIGNVYLTGTTSGTVDFDPGPGVFSVPSNNYDDVFIQKLDSAGSLVWVKKLGANGMEGCNSIKLDTDKNVYITGYFGYTVDFDPGPGVYDLTGAIFALKLDSMGNFLWAKSIDGTFNNNQAYSHHVDALNNIYITGRFAGTTDFDPGPGVTNALSTPSGYNCFVLKLDTRGDFIWVKTTGDIGKAITIDYQGNILVAGNYSGTNDFDPNNGETNLSSNGSLDFFVLKLRQHKITGRIYQDFDQDCVRDSLEFGLANRLLLINPGNIIATTNDGGTWGVDSLPVGTYTITLDTTGGWISTCPTQNFTVSDPNSLVTAPPLGLISTNLCSAPDISIHAPFLRPGFSNQRVYIRVCNSPQATNYIANAYTIIELDPLLTLQSSPLPFTNLGNNKYQVNLGSIYPGICTFFSVGCHLSANAIPGQTLCMKAALYPIDSCALDTISNPSPIGINPCNTAYDDSHLIIRSSCNNDTINFVITNTGDGNMTCFSQVRLYIDGIFVWMDSIQLISGDTAHFTFPGDGRTWRLEVDQHPLHPGNSQPNMTIELCGNASNWTQNLINILPQDDADPVIDIYCGLVTASVDPNIKTGYPLGLGNSHDILPNQELEYVIDFQNTGTDTAFTVVIRDTLSTDLDIFSVRSGTASRPYSFKMYGPRVLEWTFNNIMLPDSNVNEPASHGFISFKVKQVAGLPLGTVIQNSAAIYFDFNAPIITNISQHTLANPQTLNWDGQATLVDTACSSYNFNSFTYNQSGTYFQVVQNAGLDSFYTLDLTIFTIDDNITINGSTLTTNAVGINSYQWLDCDNGNSIIAGQTNSFFSPSANGNYAVQMTDDNCTYISDCVNFIVSKVATSQNNLGIKIYPNPTDNKLFVEIIGTDLTANTNTATISNIAGQVLLEKVLTSKISELDLSNFPSGVYFIQITNVQKSLTEKIIKR